MKKLFPVLMVLMFFLAACGGSSNAKPTPIPFDTAVPTVEVVLNATAKPANANTDAGTERVSPVDGMLQAFIPESSFRMGGIEVKASEDERPDRTVTTSAFWMDKIEVTNAMYQICVDAGACAPPTNFHSEKHDEYFNTAEFADFPVVYVTWGNANEYCTWAGRRLPTEAEWEHAARGDDTRTFPWGDERPRDTQANFNNAIGDLTRVGSFPAGASPYGILDMSGNVWEWVFDFYHAGYYEGAVEVDPTGPDAAVGGGERHSIRGGSYMDVENDIRLSNRGYASGPDLLASDMDSVEYTGESSPRIGFRCAAGN